MGNQLNMPDPSSMSLMALRVQTSINGSISALTEEYIENPVFDLAFGYSDSRRLMTIAITATAWTDDVFIEAQYGLQYERPEDEPPFDNEESMDIATMRAFPQVYPYIRKKFIETACEIPFRSPSLPLTALDVTVR